MTTMTCLRPFPAVALALLCAAAPALAEAPPPIRTTMEALHASGGVPRGWTFAMPPGDPAAGRTAFAAMECHACHRVEGEHFPETAQRKGKGPDLTAMGSHHPAEYFAESILNPNRVIVEGAGYTGDDGLSTMPSYADSMTVKQLTDLVAYLTSLKGKVGHGHAHDTGGAMKKDHGAMKKDHGASKK
jgi:mono/diheme cytochrome c family protein